MCPRSPIVRDIEREIHEAVAARKEGSSMAKESTAPPPKRQKKRKAQREVSIENKTEKADVLTSAPEPNKAVETEVIPSTD